MGKTNMDEFKKIRDLNLAELGENPEAEEKEHGVDAETAEASEAAVVEGTEAEGEITQIEEEAEQKKEPEAYEPVGKHFFIDADVTEQEIRNFLLGHTYRQIPNLLIYVIAIGIVIFAMVRQQNVGWCLFFAVFIFAYMPVSTIFQAKTMKNKNTAFSQTFHYILDEAGCHLRIGDNIVDVEWKHFKKLMVLKTVVVAYTGKNNGYIIPTKDMGSRKDEILAFLNEKVQKK